MIDTIKAFCKCDITQFEQLPIYPQIIPEYSKEGVLIGGKTTIKNIYVEYDYIKGEIMINGSLSRYIFGNNFETMERRQVRKAITEICKEIGIDAKEWSLSRVDVSTIFYAGQTMGTIKKLLGEVKRMERTEYKNSIYWGNSNRQLLLYDKTMWAYENKKNKEIPDILKNAKWLRAEMRLLKNIARQTNSTAKLNLLYNSAFYDKICEMWLANFKAIGMRGATTTKEETDPIKRLLIKIYKDIPQKMESFVEETMAEDADKHRRYRFRKKMADLKQKAITAMEGAEKKYKDFQNALITAKAVH